MSSLPPFVYAHGEKILLGAAAVGVVWWMVSVSSDPAQIPKDPLTIEELTRELVQVDAIRKQSTVPNLAKPTDYLARMRDTLARDVPVAPVMAWLTAPPDIGPKVGNKPFFFVYETRPAEVTATDKAGTITLAIQLPAADRSQLNESRVFNQRALTIVKSGPAGTVTNSARWLGVQVQTRAGEGGEWRPLAGTGVLPGGIIPIADAARPVQLPDQEPWTVHAFRARLIVAATAFNAAAPSGSTILVHEGPFTAHETGQVEVRQLTDLWPEDAKAPGAAARIAQVMARFRAPDADVPGLAPQAGERTFLGPWGRTAQVPVTSNLRFALLNVRTRTRAATAGAEAETEQIADFQLTRYFEDAKAWMAPYTAQRVAIGEMVGRADIPVTPPGSPAGVRVPVDLATGFQVQDLRRGVVRTLYYDLVVRPSPTRPGARILDIEEKATRTEVATLVRPPNGTPFTQLALEVIPAAAGRVRPPQTHCAGGAQGGFPAVYPAQFAFAYDEPRIFATNPAEFRSFGLKPPAPVRHPPGTGPLETLRRAGLGTAVTDSDSIEFADGRLFWVNPVNRWEVFTWAPAGFAYPKGPVAVAVEGTGIAPAPTGGTQPPGPGPGGTQPPGGGRTTPPR